MNGLIDLFDAFTDGLAKKDLNKIVKLFAEDATYTVYAQGYKAVSGKSAIRAFMEDELRKFEDYNVEKLFVCEKASSIVVEWLVRFREANSTKKVAVQGVSIVDIENGLIKNWKEYIQT
jgi:limonene-1,2-epoxide hydrolase